jgi:hypothetical protein
MLTEVFTQELEALTSSGHKKVEVVEADGFINLVFPDYLLPPLYNKQSTDLLLRLPISYPNGSPDMFWTNQDLLTASGQIPTSAESIETYLGKTWRRFSWHPQGWNPGTGNLGMYLEFVNNGLIKAAKG